MLNKTLAELSKDLQTKQYSSVELTEYFLKRIEALNPELNAFITVTAKAAKEAAIEADRRIAQKCAGPLTGIPIAHKDIFCTQSIKTSCASKMLDNFIAPYDATIVKKLKDAGTILMGKTNMDEFAMGSSNEHSYYGCVKNPWNCNKVPGGSSGGSAAAVAARLVPAATGSDTGGSIRQPAAFTNLVGLKPTYGRVSRYGMIAFASSFDQAGPITKTAEDAALLLNVMAGFDPCDSTSVDHTVPDYTATLNTSLSGLKIGLPKEYFSEELDTQIADKIHEAINVFETLGATIAEISLTHTPLAIPTYHVIAPAECSSNLARYDGVRFGYRCKKPTSYQDLVERTRSEGFGDEVKHRILIGTYVLSAGYYEAFYVKAQKIRQLILQDYLKAFQHVDIILGPTTPTTAFSIGSKQNDRVAMYLSDIFTATANLTGLPAMSVPCGFIEHLPVGMQLIGNVFDEARMLNVAHQYQQETHWHRHLAQGDLFS